MGNIGSNEWKLREYFGFDSAASGAGVADGQRRGRYLEENLMKVSTTGPALSILILLLATTTMAASIRIASLNPETLHSGETTIVTVRITNESDSVSDVILVWSVPKGCSLKPLQDDVISLVSRNYNPTVPAKDSFDAKFALTFSKPNLTGEIAWTLKEGGYHVFRSVLDTKAQPIMPPAVSETSVDQPKPVDAVEILLKQAKTLCGEHRFREAEMLLTKAIQIAPNSVVVLRMLGSVQRDMATSSLKAGSLLSAAQEGDRARMTVKNLKSTIIDPTSPNVDPKMVVLDESETERVCSMIQEAIDSSCLEEIGCARQNEKDAHCWYWKNDRKLVIRGLKHLKQVFELGAWASEPTRNAANAVLVDLKTLVRPEEWEGLLAQSGLAQPQEARTKN